jgi:hypothetical protein
MMGTVHQPAATVPAAASRANADVLKTRLTAFS